MAEIIVDGVIRRCMTQPNPAGHVTKLMAFGDVHPIYTDAQIQAVITNPSRVPSRVTFDKTWILDQKQFGSCQGHAEAGTLQRTRYRRGFNDHLLLSGAYAYSRVNNHADNGSALIDGEHSIMQGICPLSLVGPTMIYPELQPANAVEEAAKHKASVVYHLPDWQSLISALTAGFDCVVAVMVGNNFARLNSHGIAGVDAGSGNHAVAVDDVCLVNGQIIVDMPNSWGTSFGVDGRAYLTQAHFTGTIHNHDFYCVASMNEAGE